jgi:hypothetical protein
MVILIWRGRPVFAGLIAKPDKVGELDAAPSDARADGKRLILFQPASGDA